MSDNTKENDIVTEILDNAFNKPWEVYSPEKFKRQIAETQAMIRDMTPEQKKKIMNKCMSLRVQVTALYRKNRHKSEATKKGHYQAFCYACDHLADTCNLQKVSNITPTHFRRVAEYWKSYKAPNTVYTELSGFRYYCELAGCKHPMPQNKELKLKKRNPKEYNRGWLLAEYQKARALADFMRRHDVRDGLDFGWHLGLRIIEACQLKVGDAKKALGWGGPDIKGKGGQVRFVKIEIEEQVELLKRLYREAKAKGFTDDDFIISKTIHKGPLMEKSLSKTGSAITVISLPILTVRRRSIPAKSPVLINLYFTVFAILTIKTVKSDWRVIRENIKSSVRVWDTAACR